MNRPLDTTDKEAVSKQKDGENQFLPKEQAMIKVRLTKSIAPSDFRRTNKKLKTVTNTDFRQTRIRTKTKSCPLVRQNIYDDRLINCRREC